MFVRSETDPDGTTYFFFYYYFSRNRRVFSQISRVISHYDIPRAGRFVFLLETAVPRLHRRYPGRHQHFSCPCLWIWPATSSFPKIGIPVPFLSRRPSSLFELPVRVSKILSLPPHAHAHAQKRPIF